MSRRGKGRGRGRGSHSMGLDQEVLVVQSNRPGSSSGNSTESDLGPPISVSELMEEFPELQIHPRSSTGRGRGQQKNRHQNMNSGSRNALRHEQSTVQLPLHPDHSSSENPNRISSGSENSVKSTSKDSDKGSDSIESLHSEDELPLCPSGSKFPSRPDFGKAGRPIDLITNYFTLSVKQEHIYHYDVEINSLDQIKKYGKPVKKRTAAEAAKANISNLQHELEKNLGKMKCQQIFEQLVHLANLQSFHPVYDGNKNIFTSKRLPPQFDTVQNFTVELQDSGKARNYSIVVKPVNKKNGSNCINLEEFLRKNYEGRNEIIMAFNSILNHRNPPSCQVQIGRSFFYLNQTNKISLGEGLEIWFGYNQSVHLTQKGPAVVINLAAKAFHKEGSAIEYINEVLRRDITRGDRMKNYEIQKVEEALKGVRVNVTHLKYPRKYFIQGVSKISAQELKVECNGQNLTIAQYFQTKYGKLRFPFLHCFSMRSSNNQTYIPLEHCSIVKGQPKFGKLTPALGSKMIRQTAIVPHERFRTIQQGAQDVQRESGEKMKNYNLFLDLKPRCVKGRVIAPPSLAYYNKDTSNPDDRGVWRMEGKCFYKASIEIESWTVLSFAEICDQKELQKFADILGRAGKKVGLNLNRLVGVKRFSRQDTAEKVLRDASNAATFAVIVLSRKDYHHNYDEIKFIADYKLGFVTQCIEDSVLKRINEQIASNICLKINTKLGGINHILLNRPRVFSKPVIVFGADAVHSPRGMGCPSIAALVGSLDAYPSKYKVACRVQENEKGKVSQELILETEDMVKSILKAFYQHTKGKHPEKIIFFRDGVSEGQFAKVRDFEVCAIQKASNDVFGFIIPLTFVIVQKRHQTRFRPQNPRDGIGRGGNVPPGTTVDIDITDPEQFDYYLNSHEGIQGTSKPAHYTVLHDDNKFCSDELQQLSFHLCFTYSRCNRSISIPAPVMYADLACYRAKKYADFHMQKEKDRCSSSSDSSVKLPDHARQAINSMGEYKTSMFFV